MRLFLVGLLALGIGAGGAALMLRDDSSARIATASEPASPKPAAETPAKRVFASSVMAEIMLAPQPATNELPTFARAITARAIDVCRQTSNTQKPDNLFWDAEGSFETCYWSTALSRTLANGSAPSEQPAAADCTITAPELPSVEVSEEEPIFDPDTANPEDASPEATAPEVVPPGEVIDTPDCRPDEPESLFFTARADDTQVLSMRFKLNSSARQLERNLASLRQAFESLMSDRGWSVDGALVTAIGAGSDHEATDAGVRYRFKREFGDVPRFNLTIDFLPDAIDRLSTDFFTPPEKPRSAITPGTQTPAVPLADPSGTSAPSDPAFL